MIIGERLYEALKKLHLSQAGLADKIGISSVVINRYCKDKTTPNAEFLNKLALNYNISINWLLTGEGSMFYSGDEDVRRLKDGYYYNLPIVAAVSCGSPLEIESAEPLDHVLVNQKDLPGKADEYFAFFAQGQSMHPYISHGDVVVVRQDKDWRRAEGHVCVVNVEGEVTLKKVSTLKDGKEILLSPYNTDFSPLLLTEDRLQESRLVGIALMAVRNL
ncbi:MAG: XRE family transcriptional regulator [Candidatus Cloacimonetes bacterium]|nr:XRE family transcriptional regulator [Candidatus Cloacimonadota bacterium]